jgi:hypothetical protein
MAGGDMSRLQNQDNFNAWKLTTSNQLTSFAATTTSGSTPPTTAESAKLIAVSADVFNTTACIQEQLTQLAGTTNTIHDTQQAILDVNEEIKKAEADVSIARDRVAYIRHPDEHTSYYESWFPIDRPMHKENIPYFVAATVFVVIFSTLVAFSLVGIDITIQLQDKIRVYLLFLYSQFTWLTLLLALALVYAIYYFMGMKQSSR